MSEPVTVTAGEPTESESEAATAEGGDGKDEL